MKLPGHLVKHGNMSNLSNIVNIFCISIRYSHIFSELNSVITKC